MKKNNIKFIIRALISIAVLCFLLSKIEFSSLKQTLCNFNPLFYICAVLVLFIHLFFLAYAWRITLLGKNINIAQKDIYRAVLTSFFFGSFLPSAMGPDIILTFNIGKSLPEKQHAPSSLLFIRLIHVAAIFLVSGIVLFFIAKTFALKQILVLTWILSLSIWISYWIAIHPASRRLAERISNRHRWLRFIHKIFHSFSTFGLDNKVLIKVWFLGLCMAFIKVMIDYLIARALGLHIPYLWFLGLVPAISIITLLPISIAGLGVREGAYVGVFSNMGIPAANSFSISLMVFTLNIILCLIGGVLYLIHGAHVKHKSL